MIPLAMSLLVLAGKSRELFTCFLVGIAMCLFASQINGLIAAKTAYDSYTLTTSLTPVVEEITKAIPILMVAFVLQSDRQTLIECSLMVGLGFATMENMYILTSNSQIVNFVLAASRGCGAAMVHATTSLIVSYGISYCRIRKKTSFTGTYAVIVCAMIFHGIYNMLVQSGEYVYLGFLLPTIIFVPISIYVLKDREKSE